MTEQVGLPAYLPLDEVAQHAGVASETYRRLLSKMGAIRRVGNERLVISDKLREVEPSVYERVLTARMLAPACTAEQPRAPLGTGR